MLLSRVRCGSLTQSDWWWVRYWQEATSCWGQHTPLSSQADTHGPREACPARHTSALSGSANCHSPHSVQRPCASFSGQSQPAGALQPPWITCTNPVNTLSDLTWWLHCIRLGCLDWYLKTNRDPAAIIYWNPNYYNNTLGASCFKSLTSVKMAVVSLKLYFLAVCGVFKPWNKTMHVLWVSPILFHYHRRTRSGCTCLTGTASMLHYGRFLGDYISMLQGTWSFTKGPLHNLCLWSSVHY